MMSFEWLIREKKFLIVDEKSFEFWIEFNNNLIFFYVNLIQQHLQKKTPNGLETAKLELFKPFMMLVDSAKCINSPYFLISPPHLSSCSAQLTHTSEFFYWNLLSCLENYSFGKSNMLHDACGTCSLTLIETASNLSGWKCQVKWSTQNKLFVFLLRFRFGVKSAQAWRFQRS